MNLRSSDRASLAWNAGGCRQLDLFRVVDGLVRSCATGKIRIIVTHFDIKRFGFYASVFDGEIQCHIFHFHFFQTRLALTASAIWSIAFTPLKLRSRVEGCRLLASFQYRAHGCVQIRQHIDAAGKFPFRFSKIGAICWTISSSL